MAAMNRIPFWNRNRVRVVAGVAAWGVVCSVASAADGAQATGLWPLFRQSFDVFTIVLLMGSMLAVSVIVRCLIDIRRTRILPARAVRKADEYSEAKRWEDLRTLVTKEDSLVSRIVRAAMDETRYGGEITRSAIREAAEMAASEEVARWFRKIELLNIIGNLGPLVGLAGTVWGMILAFTSLGESGGQAGPSALSLGISKALFHTLLGLVLAVPCLLIYGFYRSIIDKHCTRGMVVASKIVERLPAHAIRAGASDKKKKNAEATPVPTEAAVPQA